MFHETIALIVQRNEKNDNNTVAPIKRNIYSIDFF